jgi:hypothetical protein
MFFCKMTAETLINKKNPLTIFVSGYAIEVFLRENGLR